MSTVQKELISPERGEARPPGVRGTAAFGGQGHASHNSRPAVAAEISDRLLTCAACTQLVQADDVGTLEYHEVRALCCTLPAHGCVQRKSCEGSYTRGYPPRPLPEAQKHAHAQSFSYLKFIEGGVRTQPKESRSLLPVAAHLLTSRTAAESNYRAVSDVLRDAAAWIEAHHVDDADFEGLQLTRRFLPQASDENDFYFEAIIFHRAPVSARV